MWPLELFLLYHLQLVQVVGRT